MERDDGDVIGDRTVAAAREENLAPEIAAIVGFRVSRVRRRLKDAHGSKLVRNAFDDVWPQDDGDEDEYDALGDTTVAAARDEGLASQIAAATGLRTAAVRRHLERAHGRSLVRNAFDEDWPTELDDTEEVESPDDLEALGEMTVAAAREYIRRVAEVTGLRASDVRRQLGRVHGKTLLRNVFPEHWANGTVDAAEDDAPESTDDIEVRLQGRPKHRAMQQALVDLGELKKYHVRTNYPIGAGFKPDVLWFRLNPSEHPNAAPIAAFEVEFGSAQAIAKSLASLKHAYDLAAQNLYLILPSTRVESAKLRLQGAFHEIAESIRVLPIESTVNLSFPDLAKRLRVQ
jgi:hypothetical protein